MKKHLRYRLFAAAFAISMGTAAYADSVNVTLEPATVSASPGSTAFFTANISAPLTNAAPVFLNGYSISLQGPGDITFDGSDVFNFPALNPGDSDMDVLFTANIPVGETPGDYTGFYVLQGGSTEDAQNTLGTDTFALDVVASGPPAVTPEPSTWCLTASGLFAVLSFALRRSPLQQTTAG